MQYVSLKVKESYTNKTGTILPQDKRPRTTLTVSGSGQIKGFQKPKKLMIKHRKTKQQ